jgi:hypothetical protein
VLLIGVGHAELAALAPALGASETCSPVGDSGWLLAEAENERSEHVGDAADGVRRWLSRGSDSWAVVVAPCAAEDSLTVWQAALDTNLNVCRDVGRVVAATKGVSRLVFVTWDVPPGSRGAALPLVATAAAVGQLGRALATELGAEVLVNTVTTPVGDVARAASAVRLALDPGCGYLVGEVLNPSASPGLVRR